MLRTVFTCIIVSSLFFAAPSRAQLLFEENFDYPDSSIITENGWDLHSGSGGNPIRAYAPGLTFPGYKSSAIGNAVFLNGGGDDANRTFPAVNTDSLYVSFMVNVQSAPTGSPRFFLHLAESTLDEFFARVSIKTDDSTDVEFSINKQGAGGVSTDNNYQFNKTYLLVVKYVFIDSTENDCVSLFVFDSTLSATEPPEPTVTALIRGVDPVDLSRIALRQNTATPDVTVWVDGIRISQQWEGPLVAIRENPENLPLAKSFKLSQNYPNPFNPETTLRFTLFEGRFNSAVQLKIVNSLGQLIHSKYWHALPAGQHEYRWDGRDNSGEIAAAGVYFATLSNSHSHETIKMLLVH